MSEDEVRTSDIRDPYAAKIIEDIWQSIFPGANEEQRVLICRAVNEGGGGSARARALMSEYCAPMADR